MSKEQYYNKIKKFVYRKFEELELVERNNGNFLYLCYKNNEEAQIRINKKSGLVLYTKRFGDKINMIFRLEQIDFEILLSIWVEDTFKMKVISTERLSLIDGIVVEGTFQIKFR
jgi:hypothetical protein